MKYSVFTVTTPEFDPEETISLLARLGYDGLEWRVTDPSPEGVPVNYWSGNRCTLDVNRITALAEPIRRMAEKAGLLTPILSSYLGANQLEPVRKVMEAASVMGARAVRISVPSYNGQKNYNEVFQEALGHYSRVEVYARETGVKAVFEIHMGNICPSASLAHRFAANFNPEHVGAIYDPGNMVYEGYENWQMGLELLGPYLAHVHVKNGRMDLMEVTAEGEAVWRYSSCSMRSGQVRWMEVLRALRRVGYDGWLSMEDFSPAPTEEKLAKDLEYVKSLLHQVDLEKHHA